ncbi:ATP-dependent helicase C-terminal domain-containing protein [Treponema berlinense]|uniref:ATP-dependent helicase C-terminal domain-containing protein n=1 Tax=Treponema berlinense TaxID=225004 RepID=UPI003F0D314B
MVFDALFYFLNGTKIDSSVPSSIILENGKKAKIKYESRLISSEMLNIGDYLTNVRLLNVIPILEIIIQQIFGCFSTPKISGIPVLLKLLSPARRPLQITDNLENFWSGAWIEICKEMKGRYPKHNWDYRLTTDS